MIEFYNYTKFMVLELIFSLCFVLSFTVGFLSFLNTDLSNTKFKKLLIYFFTILIIVSIQISIINIVINYQSVLKVIIIHSIIYLFGIAFSLTLVKSNLLFKIK